MDIELGRLLFDIAQFVLTGAIAFYVYISNKNRATNERVTKLQELIDAQIDDHAARLATVEEFMRHVPAAGDIAEVREMIARVGGDVKGLKAEVQGVRDVLKPMQRTIELVNEFLLKDSR